MHKLQTTLLLGLVATGGVLAASYTPPATAVSSRVDLELSDVVSIRVLDKTATTEIDSIDLELITTPTGAFTSDNFIVEASTSNPTGYKLYMSTDFQKGSPAEYTTDLVNQEDDTYTIPTLGTSDVSLADFSQARGSYVNRWGYSLDNLTYDPVPAHGTTEEIGSSSTASAADRTDVYVALNANMDKISGLYKNTLVFSSVANPIQTAYSLHFLPGTPDTVIGLPEDQSVSEISASHTFTIPSNVPTRAGYNFTGYTDGTTTYQPEDSITVLGGEDYTGSATLTAMWEEIPCTANHICFMSNEPSGTVSGTMEDQTIVYMTSTTAANTVDETTLSSSTTELTLYSPNWTLSGYGFRGWSTTPEGTAGTMYGPNQTITLTSDQQTALGSRGLVMYAQWVASEDSNNDGVADSMAGWTGCSSLSQGSVTALTYGSDTYAVAKLADGKCWMIENLRYDSESTSSSTSGTGQKTTSFSTSSYTLRQYNVTNISGSNPSPTNTGSTAIQWKSYGGYYSWASAIGDSSAHETQYMNPDTAAESRQGVCPSGWRLPRSYAGDSTTNNANSDFRNLNNELNGSWTTVSTAAASNNWRKYPNNFVFAGFWSDTSSVVRGTTGFYWSSTVYHSLYAYGLRFTSTAAYPVSYDNKFDGLSVRCLIGP